jgi:hypothetical protein
MLTQKLQTLPVDEFSTDTMARIVPGFFDLHGNSVSSKLNSKEQARQSAADDGDRFHPLHASVVRR